MSNPIRQTASRYTSLPGNASALQQLGLAAIAMGGCLGFYARVIGGRERFDVPAFASALRNSGLSVLPALTLISLSVGIILGNLAGGPIGQLNLPGLLAMSIGYTVAVELAPILTGVLVAGRAGIWLAVRQASLHGSDELDGLLLCGIDPIQFTLAPAMLAMLVMSFAFAVWSTLVTFASAGVWLWGTAGIPLPLFADMVRSSFQPGDLMAAFLKPPAFALVIAIIATVNGNLAGRGPDSIPRAASRTMIGAVTAILLLDLLFVLLLFD
jgi:phospholipid/cholesterol/gamma-HCH transport system permease protein